MGNFSSKQLSFKTNNEKLHPPSISISIIEGNLKVTRINTPL